MNILIFAMSDPSNPSTESKVNRVQQLQEIQNKALELFKKKNADYGDAFAEFGIIGVLMRIQDKISRLFQFLSRE